jgi:Tat protein secretion system quality control protein TatD with DNase activity
VNGFLLFISSCLGLSSLQALLTFVGAEQMAKDHLFNPFLEEEIVFLKKFDLLSGLDVKDVYDVEPTRVSELLHFRTLTNLILRLTPSERDEAMMLMSYRNADNTPPSSGYLQFKIDIIDCHFHLDELVGRTGKSLEELESEVTSNSNLVHAIANFVYPGKWKLIDRINFGARISFSLGVHPHLLLPSNVHQMFARLEKQFERYPQAIAIGEVGLDFTTTCRCGAAHNKKLCVEGKIQAQYQFLEMSLRLADRLGKPIIIHCRDKKDGTAAKGVLDMFISLKLTHLKVQRHCFIGNSQEFDNWSRILPNCYFSLSRSSTVDQATREAIMLGDHQKLLLETDSPYLSFPDDRCHGPWRVGQVAQAVSNMIGMPFGSVVRLSNSNARGLFNLKN